MKLEDIPVYDDDIDESVDILGVVEHPLRLGSRWLMVKVAGELMRVGIDFDDYIKRLNSLINAIKTNNGILSNSNSRRRKMLESVNRCHREEIEYLVNDVLSDLVKYNILEDYIDS